MDTVITNFNHMMINRGYDLTETDGNIRLYKNTEDKKVVTWLYTNEKLNIDSIKDFVLILENKKCVHGIIIYNSTVTSSSKKVLEHIQNYKIELFSLNEFSYNLTEHMYYCPHKKLNKEEAEHVKTTFGTKLPYLLKTDPVVRYFYFQKNDIIEITRRNGSIAYRIVK